MFAMKRISVASAILFWCLAMPGKAADTAPSPYAGEESRAVKSLSAEDVAELRRGGGWGLARAAELNGMPGPLHLLELKDAIPLTREQVSAITAIYKRMREAAIAEGQTFIAAERALDDAFRAGTVTVASLREMLTDIARSRARLRFVHLSAHLETPALLTREQIARYDALRGYRLHGGGTAHGGHDSRENYHDSLKMQHHD